MLIIITVDYDKSLSVQRTLTNRIDEVRHLNY